MHRYKVVTSCAWYSFGAVPAGARSGNGLQFLYRGINAYYWSSSVGNSSNAWYRQFGYNSAQVYRYNGNRSTGFTVRCVRESKRHKHKLTAFLTKNYSVKMYEV
jgi:uncharacterized protein (TIGR02145 family)